MYTDAVAVPRRYFRGVAPSAIGYPESVYGGKLGAFRTTRLADDVQATGLLPSPVSHTRC